jgi:hypothetical protein
MDKDLNHKRRAAPRLAALTLLLGLSAAGSAQAVTYNMGVLSAVPYINTTTVSAGTTFTLPNTGALLYNFADRYDFSIVGSPSVAGTAVTVDLDLGSLGYSISNLRLDLFNAGNTWQAGDMVSGAADASVSVLSPLVAGNYYFMIRGTADGTLTNSGIYTFTAAAVPEAHTYGMMLAGLGLVGYTVSRRKRTLN